MTTVIEQDPHALAILAALESADVQAGDAEAPHEIKPDSEAWTAYTVLYLLNGGGLDGTLCDPEADGHLPFQLTSVGRTPAEARFVADRAAAALTSQPIEVTGRSVLRCRRTEAGSGSQRDDEIEPPLFYAVARFTLTTTPNP